MREEDIKLETQSLFQTKLGKVNAPDEGLGWEGKAIRIM